MMTVNTGHRENTVAYELTTPQISYKRASEYAYLTEHLSAMDFRYKNVSVGSIGVSVMGRDIPVITLGSKKSSPGVLYIGGFCGCDVISPAVLLRFIGDYMQFLEEGRRMYSASMPYLYEMRNIHIIPMINPDGYVIRREGVDDIPIAEKLIEKNGGEDFSAWRYNSRGADLMRVFSHTDTMGGGVSAIIEPEAVALARYVSMSTVGVFGEIKLALSLIGEGCGIGYRSKRGTAPRSKTVGRLIERMSTLPLDDDEIDRGSFSEWFIGEINRPAFDVRCIPDGVVTTDPDDYVRSYASLREVLFSAPLLI